MEELQRLAMSQDEFLDFVKKCDIAIAIYRKTDYGPKTVAVSDGFVRLFGYDEYEEAIYVMDNDMYCDTHPDDRARIQEAAVMFSNHDDTYDVTYRTKNATRDDWLFIRARGVHVDSTCLGRVSLVVYTTEGDSVGGLEHRLGTEVLARETDVRYDELTGLQMFNCFLDKVQLRMDMRRGRGTSIVYLDIADMKSINALDGLDVGNKVILRTGEALASVFGSESCARASSDRFVAMCPTISAAGMVGRAVDAASRTHDSRTMHVHVGIYDVQDIDDSAVVAYDRAKWAATVDAGTHTSTVARFDKAMSKDMEMDSYVRTNIDTAINNGDIRVWYQPIVDARNFDVVRYEALSRWFKKPGEMLSPVSFMSTLESSHACAKLDTFVMKSVANESARRIANKKIPSAFSLNISRVDFSEVNVAHELSRILDSVGVPHDRVAVEITESAAETDTRALINQINKLHDNGFSVWMDDFGTGLSSLGALYRLNFDLVKLDMGLIRDVASSEKARTMINYIVKMARQMHIPILAEGVETREQEEFLVNVGCDFLQGYLYGKPLPLETSFVGDKVLV